MRNSRITRNPVQNKRLNDHVLMLNQLKTAILRRDEVRKLLYENTDNEVTRIFFSNIPSKLEIIRIQKEEIRLKLEAAPV